MTKLRIDMSRMTLDELDDVAELLHERWGVSLADAMQGRHQQKAIKALAWVVMRRDDPAYTYEQAGAFAMGDLEMVNPDPGEPAAGDNGAAPVMSLASGD